MMIKYELMMNWETMMKYHFSTEFGVPWAVQVKQLTPSGQFTHFKIPPLTDQLPALHSLSWCKEAKTVKSVGARWSVLSVLKRMVKAVCRYP